MIHVQRSVLTQTDADGCDGAIDRPSRPRLQLWCAVERRLYDFGSGTDTNQHDSSKTDQHKYPGPAACRCGLFGPQEQSWDDWH